MAMLEDYGVSDEKGYADLKEINKAIGTYITTHLYTNILENVHI